MNHSINEISFKSKECKYRNHFLCEYQWEGFGFQIFCNCDCHRKLLGIEKDVLNPHSSNEYNFNVKLDHIGEVNK